MKLTKKQWHIEDVNKKHVKVSPFNSNRTHDKEVVSIYLFIYKLKIYVAFAWWKTVRAE